ncbi:polyprenyl synthetase family protein [Streptomyces silvisoli]|uniref:Polyprenyl synthetase family protein n=1 Tax=Streptomyces silvisoli TaxID=3034235 RepID=A0ABT5ZFV7_9ACTN|nr:polyprenyl synthetase family protein [Streptomyces silvisoli]MDF3287873.1 polyprenyl synthetase family protein [Streptomyces silvisoli]
MAADLRRVREVIGPVRIPGRPDLAGLVGERSESTRRWVRPTLALLSYYALSGPDRPADERVVRCAAAVELIHVGSLYHDDVIDQAKQRRGEPSHNALWGSGLAVLGGDFVLLHALGLLAEHDSRVTLAGVLAGEEMCAGMVAEAADRYLRSRSEGSYWRAIGGKTAALLSLSCRLGAMLAGQGTEQEEALARFGHRLGLSYQLRDDILDLTAAPGQLGKPVNNDLVEGVYTLPVLWALTREPRLAPLLRRGITRHEAARARDLVLACGAVADAQARANELLRESLDLLGTMPDRFSVRAALADYARAVLSPPAPSGDVPPPRTPVRTPPPRVNAHQERARKHVTGWLRDTGLAVTPEELNHHRWVDVVDGCARWFPDADADVLEPLSCLVTWAAVLDDLFDDPALREPQDIAALHRGLTVMLHQDAGAHGAIARAWAELLPRLCRNRSTAWRQRMIGHVEEWFAACACEAEHRVSGYLPGVADYLPLRMAASGWDLAVDVLDLTLDEEIPPSVRDHPFVRRIEQLAALAGLARNDLETLDRDEAAGSPYNLVRAVRQETGCTREEAVETVREQAREHLDLLHATCTYAPALVRTISADPAEQAACARLVASATDRLTLMLDWQRHSARFRGAADPAATNLARLRAEIALRTGP